jgi:branched-chain amino acid aminotransferase
MVKGYIFLNDAFVEAQSAALHVTDLAIQRGYGIFDFLKTVNGRALSLDDHLDRFYFSAQQMRLSVRPDKAELAAIITELMRKNDLPDSGIKITLTGGYSQDGFSIAEPNLIITQQPLVLTDHLTGLRLLSYEHSRQLPHVKTIDYLMPVWLQPLLAENSADDLLYHRNSYITECPRSNFFVVTAGGTLVTAADGVLKGVTRKKILDLAAPHFRIEERPVTLDEAYAAREAFISSTTKNVIAVTAIDGRPIGTGAEGEVTRWLWDAIWKIEQ